MKRKPKQAPSLAEIRRAVANYIGTEGCSCCRVIPDHDEHKAALGKLLRVKKYADGSGYDFGKYTRAEP